MPPYGRPVRLRFKRILQLLTSHSLRGCVGGSGYGDGYVAACGSGDGSGDNGEGKRKDERLHGSVFRYGGEIYSQQRDLYPQAKGEALCYRKLCR